MTRTFLTIALCLGAIFVSAQSQGDALYSFSGKLIDEETGSPIMGSTVFVEMNDSSFTTASDVLGEFFLSLPKKPDVFKVESIVYSAELIPNNKGVYVLKSRIVEIQACYIQVFKDTKVLSSTSPISILSPSDLNSADNSSLQEALNTVPGVKMDSRGYGGSRRINIRGSFVRSPFAVRNIKIYLDGFPITSPDGQAALELLDDYDLKRIQIIKGPNGNAYGAGNGGVMKAYSKTPIYGTSVESRITAGSFGYYKSASNAAYANDKLNVRLSFLQQHTDGNRQQEFNDRQQLSLNLNYKLSSRLSYSLWATDYSGTWGLPGSLTEDQIRIDPRQALSVALENNARVDRERTRIGVKQKFTSRYFSNETMVYYNTTTKINPFAASDFFKGYKDEAASGYGARNELRYEIPSDGRWRFKLHNDLEFTLEDNELAEYGISFGSPTDLRYLNKTTSSELVANIGVDAVLDTDLTIEAGVAYSLKSISSENQIGPLVNQSPNDVDRTFSGILPYAGVNYKVLPYTFLFSSVSIGYSPPSVFELIDPESGVLSTDLAPEEALNVEFGIRRGTYHDRSIQFELNVYQMDVSNAIFQYEDEIGVVRFGNRQSLIYQGIEGSVSKVFAFKSNKIVKEISLQFSGTAQNYQLKDTEDPTEEGNRVAGVPLASASGEMRIGLAYGFEVRAQHQWHDQTPLNDANTLSFRPYQFLNLRAGWNLSSFKENSTWTLEVFGGIQNVFDTQYTSFFSLNAFGGRSF
ncbi:MAG: iron complex outermembrane receptor protein, partial [Flavobacteriales bacterium]